MRPAGSLVVVVVVCRQTPIPFVARLEVEIATTLFKITILPYLKHFIHHFRFYEEGDAASMVIPRESDFRKNIDWLDNNFPREVSGRFQVTSGWFEMNPFSDETRPVLIIASFLVDK